VAEEISGNDWLGPVPAPAPPETQTRLNYVIPGNLEHLLARYCVQTEMKPGPLVRRLITDFMKGEIVLTQADLDHPRGKRTSVDLPVRLLDAFEGRCEEIKAPTKAAVIAALLREFLPPRVSTEGIEKIAVSVPTTIYNKIYKRYGPGPAEEVIVEALCDLIQKNESRAIPAEQEA